MKVLTTIAMLLLSCSWTPLLAQSSQPSEDVLLRAENRMLRSQIETQAKEIASLKAQLAGKREEPAAQTSQPATGKIMYNGKERTPAWYEELWRNYGSNVGECDGIFYDMGKARLFADRGDILTKGGVAGCIVPIYAQSPDVGDVRFFPFTSDVVQVLGGKDGVIATCPAQRAQNILGGGTVDTLFRVKGLDTEKLTEGSPLVKFVKFSTDDLWKCMIIYVGPFSYGNTLGAKTTIQDYIHPRPVTKDEFKTAINGGLVLHKYSLADAGQKHVEGAFWIGKDGKGSYFLLKETIIP